MKRTILISILSCLIISALCAENVVQPSPRLLSMDDCVDTALKNNPQIKIAAQKVVSARARKSEAFAGYLPRLTASAMYTKLSKPAFDVSPEMAATFGGALDPSLTSKDLYTGTLSLSQPIFMWGKIYQYNRQADLNSKLNDEELRKTENEMRSSVKQAFLNFLLAKKLHQIAAEAYSVAGEHYAVSKSLYDDGRISSYDVSQVKVAMSNAKSNSVKAANGVALSKSALISLLNLPEGEKAGLDFKGELSFIPVQVNKESLTKSALQNRPEIKQMELTEDISKSAIAVSKSENKPSIVAAAAYNLQSGLWNMDFNEWNKKWNASMVLTVPIFDGFSTGSKVKQSKANLEQVRQSKEQLTKGIELEIEQLCLTVEQNKDVIEVQKENMETALENLRIAKKRYEEGLMSSLEIRDAQLAATMAETNYYQSLAEYLTAAVKLEKAAGR